MEQQKPNTHPLPQKRSFIGVFLLFVLLTASIKDWDQEALLTKPEYVFSLAEMHEADYPTSLADIKFAELVNERSNERIQIEVSTDGLLGEEADVIELLQVGTIAFARVSIAPMAEYSESLNALMMPYLYEDSDHMWAVLNSELGEDMLHSISSAGMIGLAWYDSGARSFYFNEKVESLEDLSGKKVRVQASSLMFAMCEALGCIPETIPENEIDRAVLSETIDGAENNISSFESFEQYNVCKYFIVDEHTRIPEILAGSEAALEELSEEDWEMLKECAKETQEYEREQWNLAEQKARELLEQQGVTFIELSEEDKAEFREACESLYEEFGGDYQDIIAEIKEMVKD